MRIEWDRGKAAANLRKHGIDFADAAVALEDDNALTIEDESHDEQRFKTLALGPNLNVLLVVHAQRAAEMVRNHFGTQGRPRGDSAILSGCQT